MRRAFTLVEMMLAVVLAAMLMAAMLVVLGGVARDRRVVNMLRRPIGFDAVLGQLRWDLANARTITSSEDGTSITLVGNGSIDRESLSPNNRLVSVTYRCVASKDRSTLMREQECMDDPARPDRWQEAVAWDVKQIAVLPAGADAVGAGVSAGIPPHVRVRLESSTQAFEQELWIK